VTHQPAEYPLDVYLGDTCDLLVTWKIDGMPVLLDGWTFTAAIRRHRASEVVLAEPTVLVDDAEGGVFLVTLPPADQQALTEGVSVAVWDVQAEHSDGTVRTIVTGPVNVRRDVARTA